MRRRGPAYAFCPGKMRGAAQKKTQRGWRAKISFKRGELDFLPSASSDAPSGQKKKRLQKIVKREEGSEETDSGVDRPIRKCLSHPYGNGSHFQ